MMNDNHNSLRPYAPFILRMGLAIVFLHHGYDKVFGTGSSMGTSWNEQGLSVVLQVLVAWGELFAGVAFFFGFLNSTACIGIIGIMIGAIVTVHGRNGFSLLNGGYEYNYVLIMMCLALLVSGPGPFSMKE